MNNILQRDSLSIDILRDLYENAKIQSEQNFKEALENVLLNSQKH